MPEVARGLPVAYDATRHYFPIMTGNQNLRVLVVDDSEGAAQNLATLVKTWGYQATYATSGAAALTAAAEFRPTVVLLDLNLPDQHGYEVAKQLVKQAPDGAKLSFVAVTGWNQVADQLLSAAAGIAHHLVKPVNEDTLKTILEGYQAAQDGEHKTDARQ